MPADVGPFDGRRARRKRCDACHKRRIKCHGGIPCENCKRTNRSCKTPVKPTVIAPVFVNHALTTGTKHGISAFLSPLASPTAVVLPQAVCLKGPDRDMPYFFTSFLPMNVFTSNRVPISHDLHNLAKVSSALRYAIHAVAALHRKQYGYFDVIRQNMHSDLSGSLEAYSRSVRCIRNRISSNELLGDPSALWTTFLLGLFELMRDSTGENWLSHFLHGTCTILRLQDPECLASPDVLNTQKRTFFLATRTFEIARSLIYSSPSFLSKPKWTAALAKLWDGEGAALWHPKEALFDILPHISDLSIRALNFCETVTQLSIDTQGAMIQSLADEGLTLQESLQQWWMDAAAWDQAVNQLGVCSVMSSKPDTELMFGYLYYHAVSIYLSGTYDYHPQWSMPSAPCAPVLSRSTIDWHILEILRLSQDLLSLGAAGVLLFFPLRVAGARAVNMHSRCAILNLLHTVEKRGFVVAAAFKLDLEDLWASE